MLTLRVRQVSFFLQLKIFHAAPSRFTCTSHACTVHLSNAFCGHTHPRPIMAASWIWMLLCLRRRTPSRARLSIMHQKYNISSRSFTSACSHLNPRFIPIYVSPPGSLVPVMPLLCIVGFVALTRTRAVCRKEGIWCESTLERLKSRFDDVGDKIVRLWCADDAISRTCTGDAYCCQQVWHPCEQGENRAGRGARSNFLYWYWIVFVYLK